MNENLNLDHYNELLKIYNFYLEEYYWLLDNYENMRFEDITFAKIFRSKSVAREICNLLDIIKIYNNRKLYN